MHPAVYRTCASVLPFRGIPYRAHHGRHAEIFRDPAADLDRYRAAVFLLQFRFEEHVTPGHELPDYVGLEDRPRVYSDIAEAHMHELLFRVPEVPAGDYVGFEDLPVDIVQDDRIARPIEERPVAELGFDQLILNALLFRNIHNRADDHAFLGKGCGNKYP